MNITDSLYYITKELQQKLSANYTILLEGCYVNWRPISDLDLDIIDIIYRWLVKHFPNHTVHLDLKTIDNFSVLWQKMANGECSFAFGGIFGNTKEILKYDITFPETQDIVKIFVPKAKRIKDWTRIGRTFSPFVWFILFLNFLFICFVGQVFIKVCPKNGLRIVKNAAVYFTQIVFEQVPRYPNIFSFKILSLTLVLFHLVVNTLFRSKLLYYMTGNNYEKQVNSIDEMRQLQMRISYNNFYEEYFQCDDCQLDLYFRNNRINCSKHQMDCIREMAINNTYATLFYEKIYFYNALKISVRNNKNAIHMINDQIIRKDIFMYFRKNYSFYPVFNVLILLLKENGIIYQIENKYDLNSQKIYHRNIQTSGLTSLVLNISQLQLLFILYMFGMSFSIFVFLAEISSFKNKCHATKDPSK